MAEFAVKFPSTLRRELFVKFILPVIETFAVLATFKVDIPPVTELKL